MGTYDIGAEDSTVAGWMPWVWMALTLVAGAVTWTACLPLIPTHLEDVHSVHQVIRIGWVCSATLLGFLIWYAARSSWVVGMIAWALLSAQMFGIADEGVDRLRATDLAAQSADLLYVLAGAQILLFSILAGLGVSAHLAQRRWARVVRALTTESWAPGHSEPGA